jgi:YD repeat-containing protein
MNGQYNPGDIVFGNWKLKQLLGEGSFGRVFEAEREDFGMVYKAAVKVISIPQSQAEVISARAEGMDDASLTAYFRSFAEEIVSEFALMAQLKATANIVSYEDHIVMQHDSGFGWDILIRMELLTPLLNYISETALTRHDVIKLGIDMCRALELCQKYNIIHRDIKPENIFVSKLGDFKLGDFGIARTAEKTASGMSKKGTYTYIAPEIYNGDAYGSSVDIYSLGIVLYRLLNDNRTPFLPEYPAPITHGVREDALSRRLSGAVMPVPKNADGRLAEIVLRSCAYDPRDRYSSPMQMRQELEVIFYDREEAGIIYPRGDSAPIRSIDYIDRNAAVNPQVVAPAPQAARQSPAQVYAPADATVAGRPTAAASAAAPPVNHANPSNPSNQVNPVNPGSLDNYNKSGNLNPYDPQDNPYLPKDMKLKPAANNTNHGNHGKKKAGAGLIAVFVIAGLLLLTFLAVGGLFIIGMIIGGDTDGDGGQSFQAGNPGGSGAQVQRPEEPGEPGELEEPEEPEEPGESVVPDPIVPVPGEPAEPASPGELRSEFMYDSDGNVTRERRYDANDVMRQIIWYNEYGAIWSIDEYDEAGNHVLEFWINSEGGISSWTAFEYYPNGNLSRSVYYDGDGVVKYIYEYHLNGNTAKATWYNPDGTVWSIDEYDNDGNRTVEYMYDDNGNITETTWFNPDGTVIYGLPEA